MVDRIVLVCIAIGIPIIAIVADKLVDRTTIKKKDNQIAELGEKIISLVAEKENAQTTQKVAQSASERTSQLAQERLRTSETEIPLAEQAKHVASEEEAIALARKQVEANK